MPNSLYSDGLGSAASGLASVSQGSVVSAAVSQVSRSASGDSLASRSSAGSAASGMSATSSVDPKLLRILESSSTPRRALYHVVNSRVFTNGILAVIVLNTIVLALQTVDAVNRRAGWYFLVLDQIFLGIYLMESSVKLYVWGVHFFRSGWNNFDLFIVLTSVVTWILPVVLASTAGFDAKIFQLLRLFRTFRAIRSLRALRAISFLKSLQVIVTTLLKSIPAMSNIIVLSLLVLYIFCVIGTSMYGTVDPRRFGSLSTSFFRLFQLMTLDNWSLFYTDNRDEAPAIWFFLVAFIILETFVFINLFVAVIVNNLQSSKEREEKMKKRKHKRSKHKQQGDFVEGDYTLDANQENNRNNSRSQLNDAIAELGDTDILPEEMGLESYYPASLPSRQKELLSTYFMLLASLEFNLSFYQKQMKVLDDLVDLVREKSDGLEVN